MKTEAEDKLTFESAAAAAATTVAEEATASVQKPYVDPLLHLNDPDSEKDTVQHTLEFMKQRVLKRVFAKYRGVIQNIVKLQDLIAALKIRTLHKCATCSMLISVLEILTSKL